MFCNDLRKENPELLSLTNNADLLKKILIYKKNTANVLLGNTQFRVVKTDNENNIIENSTHSGLYNLLTPEFFLEIKNWFRDQKNNLKIISDRILRETMVK